MVGNKVASKSGISCKNMNHEPICRWLGLSVEQWPPDHYTLLGLAETETDVNLIETAVHERLNRVRSYQLSHPELATEAMNRLAEAYACLMDSEAKSAYDSSLRTKVSVESRRKTVVNPPETQRMDKVSAPDDTVRNEVPSIVEWNQTAQPPVRTPALPGIAGQSIETAPPQEQVKLSGDTEELKATTEMAAPASPAQESVDAGDETKGMDPLLEAAVGSRSARKGIGTTSGLLQRRKQTRELVANWARLGRYFKQPKRPVKNRREVKDLLASLSRIEHLLEDFPSFLARPGKPGYRIAMLAMDENPFKAFQNMDFNERVALARDWVTSASVLTTHLQFLDKELLKRHSDPIFLKWLRPCIAFLDVHRRWGYLSLILAILLLFSVLLVLFTS